MKWVILVIVLILVAPTIANRLEALDPDKQDRQGEAGGEARRRGIFYRAVRRFGPRTVLVAFVLLAVVLAVAVYLLIRRV